MKKKFEEMINVLNNSLKAIDMQTLEKLVQQCCEVQKSGNSIIVSGLGKNVPICEKFVGTMLSFGLRAGFMHTNTAIHGDLGMVHQGDLVIILTKSGSTIESVYLAKLLKQHKIEFWTLTCNPEGTIAEYASNQLVLPLEHEGDKWNIVPNNSTTLNLMILQTIAIELSYRLNVTLEQFKRNHPGGAIGEKLKNE